MNSKPVLTVLAALTLTSAPFCRAAEDDTALLQTLGYTTGQSVLVTHMAVGTLADAFLAKTYKPGEATNFVAAYIDITKGMKEHLSKLVESDTLDKGDAKFIRSTIEILDLVLQESNALKAFLSSGGDADATAYDKARKKAMKEIKTLLQMKD